MVAAGAAQVKQAVSEVWALCYDDTAPFQA